MLFRCSMNWAIKSMTLRKLALCKSTSQSSKSKSMLNFSISKMFEGNNFSFCYSNGLVVTLSKAPLEVAEAAESTTQRPNGMQLTQEQLDMLYEEPEIMTTNAMRAVYGHDPQDDKRLCPFYDPETGACWKGNSCRFEHGPKLAGWKAILIFIRTFSFIDASIQF